MRFRLLPKVSSTFPDLIFYVDITATFTWRLPHKRLVRSGALRYAGKWSIRKCALGFADVQCLATAERIRGFSAGSQHDEKQQRKLTVPAIAIVVAINAYLSRKFHVLVYRTS
jgi:hypothetical protein